MNPRIHARAILTVMLCALTACASAPPPAALAPPVAGPSALESYEQSLKELAKHVQGGEAEKTHTQLKQLLTAPEFQQLPPERQYMWLHLSALLALHFNDLDYAHATALQTTSRPNADHDDWMVRFYSAASRDHYRDAVESLKLITRRWPEALPDYDDRFLARFIREVLKSSETLDRRGLLEGLFGAQWTLQGGLEPSDFWMELARFEIERQEVDRAAEVLARITSPRTLLIMRVDKRFDPLVSSDPRRFEVTAAIDREIDQLQQLSAASPRLLELKAEQVLALVDAGRYARAITTADAVLATSATPEAAGALYTDAAEQFNWILDYRSLALQGLAKWSEAEKYLKDAASRLENGAPNVSNTINLGYFYASLGRSREAVAALGALPGARDEMSPYGYVQMQRVLLRAALAGKDAKATRAALDSIRENQSASPGTFQDALLDADHLDEAASLLISRLKDATLRSDALEDVQDYQKMVPTPMNRVLHSRWRALRARKDVQAAVAEVGRIEQFALAPSSR